MFSIWDEENPLVKEQYQKNNWVIRDCKKEDAIPVCVIYFSSNGLYYPNTEENYKKFMESDRFEWMHYHFHKAKREIYVRDIFKQWYVAGINNTINSIDALVEWLKEQIPDDCRVITVGNSSGGYMAALIGSLINADTVFDFSGQFYIGDALDDDETHNVLFKNKVTGDKEYPYLSAVPAIKNATKTDIFYFYPALCDEDKKQSLLVSQEKNVHSVAFRDDIHGQTMYNFNLEDVFAMDKDKLLKLCDDLDGKCVSRLKFSIKASGLIGTFVYMVKKLWR